MPSNKVKLGTLIEPVENRNSNEQYNLEHVRGIATSKNFIDTKANMDGVPLTSYKIVEPDMFAFVSDTSRRGDKISLAYNDSEIPYLVSSISTVFQISNKNELLSDFLFIYFNRPEFDRYTRFNSWGSARETFSWEDMCDIDIELPPLPIQQKYVDIYKAMVENQQTYERGLDDLKKSFEVLIDKYKHNANKAIGRATIKSGDILAFNGGSIDLIASSLGFSYSGGSGNPTSLPQLEFYLCNLAMNSGNPLTRGIIFNIHRALRKLANTYDYILVDTPPNGGSILNGILFFSSDYFIIPVKPDFYSLQAVDGLSDIILNWKTYLQQWFRTQNQAGLHYPDFLGVAPQMTKRYDIQGSKYAAHAKLWDDLINTRVQNFLQSYVGFTHHNNMASAEQWFKGIYPDSTPYIIKECCHFTGKLRDVAERAAIPVVFLNNAICDEYTKKVVLIDGTKINIDDIYIIEIMK